MFLLREKSKIKLIMTNIISTIKFEKLSLADADVILYPQIFQKEESCQLLTKLSQEIHWKQEPIKLFGKELLQPRLTAYYGEQSYTYSGITMYPHPWIDPLLQIKQKIKTLINLEFNGVLLNFYRDGNDYIGWHSDDEKDLVGGSVIASLSLGEKRRFLFRRRDDHKVKVELNLDDGDFFDYGWRYSEILATSSS